LINFLNGVLVTCSKYTFLTTNVITIVYTLLTLVSTTGQS